LENIIELILTISAPNVAGVYVLVFEDANGEIENKKIIVK
jgi:hypothetical protein